MSKILVTGGAGYVGSVLVRKLLDRGHEVDVLDNLRFGDNTPQRANVIKGDVRDFPTSLLTGTDVVVHLAATSKEPTSLYNTKYCLDTNYLATKQLAEACRMKDVRLIYASSTSVYFTYDVVKEPNFYEEEKVLNPISPYSITKYASEQTIRELDNYLIFRPGTHYGVSERMRLDLVVNTMTKCAYEDGKIQYLKGIYRPLVDIETITDAYVEAVEGDKIGTYNVLDFNTSLKELADKIADIVPKDIEVIGNDVEVERNYRASNNKFLEDFDVELREDEFEGAVERIWKFCEQHDVNQNKYYNKKQ